MHKEAIMELTELEKLLYKNKEEIESLWRSL